MSIPLKLSTSQVLVLPRQLDSTDFNTEETALTINASDIKLWKNGATTLASKNSGGATHIANGVYYFTLDSTDTNTLGPMLILVHVSGAMSVQLICEVYPANVYDSMFSGTDLLDVSTVQIAGSATAATRQSQLLLYGCNIDTVAASPAPTTTSFAGALTGSSYPDNCFRSGAIIFLSGSNAGLTPKVCTTFTSSSGLYTVPTLPFTPVAGQQFLIVGTTA